MLRNGLIPLNSDQPKLFGVLADLSSIGIKGKHSIDPKCNISYRHFQNKLLDRHLMKSILYKENGEEEAGQTKKEVERFDENEKGRRKSFENGLALLQSIGAKTSKSFGWSKFSKVNSIDP